MSPILNQLLDRILISNKQRAVESPIINEIVFSGMGRFLKTWMDTRDYLKWKLADVYTYIITLR